MVLALAWRRPRQGAALRPPPGPPRRVPGVDRDALNAREFSTLSESLLQSVTEHVGCCSTDERSLEVALLLRKRAANAPILVRMQQSSGLAQLLESNRGLQEIPDGLYPFGMLDETLSYENILFDRLDERAQAFDGEYLRRHAQKFDAERRIDPAHRAREELTEPLRNSNRLQADHLEAKFRAVRCALITGDHAPGLEFRESEAEMLAIMSTNAGERPRSTTAGGQARST